MIRLVLHFVVVAAAVFVAAKLVPGVEVHSYRALAIAAVSVGLVNALVRPVLAFLATPFTFLTLGLFYLVVNGAAFGLAAYFVEGFAVNGLVPAILGALVTSVVSSVLGFFVPDGD